MTYIKNFLNSINLITSDKKLSITTLLIYILTARVTFTHDIIDFLIFGLVLLNYAHKRYINFKSERIVTNRELIESIKQEFETYKTETSKKIQSIELQESKSLERIRKLENF
ncbi:hypothetical protein [Leptospira bandrabouensis]|uniref:Uncharacterized protein n=1 Tax=Leptospira bandrabouensis TaxID=2484903 RepID=A0A6H3NKL9_9LEPT|nr:hypothetical protein [Leptospira bandrabouensis]TGN09971.1 hypothetical protein EHR07_00395 [Leptospira bandrabouensis]TGN12371.1 hypothetical protein EHR08_13395 [Leptospira bandrabouensis]